LDRRIIAWLDAEAQAQIDFLAALVRQPSDNPPGDCAAHGKLTGDLIEAMGLTVERLPVPAAECRAVGMVSATNLVVRHRFGPGPTVALNAHGDVVPPGDGWRHDPYGAEVENGWMYGRGIAVSKSDIATYLFALRALIASGAKLKGTVELHVTYDEETGGRIGPAWLLAEGHSKPDYAICPGFSYDVVVAHNGCLQLEITVRGKSAHAAWPDTGIDAMQGALPILNAIYGLRPALAERRSKVDGIDTATVVVGRIDGGTNTNVVPDKVILRLDRRIVPEEDATAAEAELRALVAQAAPADVQVSVELLLLARPLTPTPESQRLAELLQRHGAQVLGQPVGRVGVPIYADARHYAEAGIPTVMYGAGPKDPLDANGHRADERIELKDLRAATEVVACAIAELLV
jgi:acetylornithine deacetylase/succinyl-diaminopimelate desuccinylase-like protein